MLVNVTLSVLLMLYLAGCSSTTAGLYIGTTTGTGASEQIPAKLLKPDGAGAFPAVVIMHDCSGLGPRSSGAPERWAKELLTYGYVVLIPDSFTTRGHAGGICTNPSPSRTEVSPFRRTRDAYAALSYLRTLPYVDKSQIGIMGGSHGGSTTLASMVSPESDREPLAREKRAGFAAAVALYPNCAIRLGSWRAESRAGTNGPTLSYVGAYKAVAPLLILIGENDDWTPAEPCRKLTDASVQEGYPVAINLSGGTPLLRQRQPRAPRGGSH